MAPREDLVFSAQARTIIKCTLPLPVVLRLHVCESVRHTEHTFHTLAQINDLGSGGAARA